MFKLLSQITKHSTCCWIKYYIIKVTKIYLATIQQDLKEICLQSVWDLHVKGWERGNIYFNIQREFNGCFYSLFELWMFLPSIAKFSICCGRKRKVCCQYHQQATLISFKNTIYFNWDWKMLCPQCGSESCCILP